MALCAWRLKGAALLGLVRTVLRDQDMDSCMCLIGNRQCNSECSRQKEAVGKGNGKGGKGGRGGESRGGDGQSR